MPTGAEKPSAHLFIIILIRVFHNLILKDALIFTNYSKRILTIKRSFIHSANYYCDIINNNHNFDNFSTTQFMISPIARRRTIQRGKKLMLKIINKLRLFLCQYHTSKRYSAHSVINRER